jgi:hypothetical protein
MLMPMLASADGAEDRRKCAQFGIGEVDKARIADRDAVAVCRKRIMPFAVVDTVLIGGVVDFEVVKQRNPEANEAFLFALKLEGVKPSSSVPLASWRSSAMMDRTRAIAQASPSASPSCSSNKKSSAQPMRFERTISLKPASTAS